MRKLHLLDAPLAITLEGMRVISVQYEINGYKDPTDSPQYSDSTVIFTEAVDMYERSLGYPRLDFDMNIVYGTDNGAPKYQQQVSMLNGETRWYKAQVTAGGKPQMWWKPIGS